jgi:hypothetical protein
MHKSQRRCLLIVPVLMCSLLSCSGLDDSTDLGAGVIEDVYPGRVTIEKHIREYRMDSSSCDTGFSLPGPGDTAFGIHWVTDSNLVIGTQGNERAAAFVQFTPDTASHKLYSANDTLRSIVIRFFCDSNSAPRNVMVWRSIDRLHALNPNAVNGDRILDTMGFTGDSVAAVPDSVVLGPGVLADTIFAACTTSVHDSATLALRPVIGFILTTLNASDTIMKFHGKPQISCTFKRGSTDTSITYGSSFILNYLATDGNPDSLQKIPVLSYATQRTAVFRYNADSLWSTIGAMDNQHRAQIVSAVFALKGPAAGDTLNVRYLLNSTLVRNGYALDSLFAVAPAKQSAATVPNTSLVLANVLTSLQNFTRNGRPGALYLYVRFAEDSNQKWKKTVRLSVPLLSAMIAVP